jgi:hypothetical protein
MADIPWDELMDAAEGSDFAPVPQSDYDVKISATEATTSSTDKPMWKITADIESGPHEGRKLFTQQTLTMDNPNALNIFFRQMAAAGLTSEFFKTKPNNQQIADALLGRRFRAKVIIKEYQGLPRNEIKAWNPPAGAGGAPGGPPPGASTAPPPPPPSTSSPSTASAPPPPPPPPSAPAPSAAPPASTEQPAPVTASAAPPPPPPAPSATPAESAPPAAGGADAWVVEERKTGSTEEPPF